ncbi:ImmA/IrrE family metallo-endopeptidase [Enterococcus xiangfangensis]|uniref:ImmA/IrrE family metallo-endopeptidase n=1 Tax=Enterococcus xiangfangensis TaxID=1296537 RepID=UPI003D175784|nr:ImmA/IrrE family metallo-endopeptidase [Enterococcus asini]
MDKYETMLDEISSEVPVIETDLENLTGYTGLYRNGRLYLDRNRKLSEKIVVLAEEYAHHKLTTGNIIDYRSPGAWKEEWKARRYAIEKIVSLDDLLNCALNDCHSKLECAEYLDVTPDFIEEALTHYHSKFGSSHYHRNYQFFFDEDSISIRSIRHCR